MGGTKTSLVQDLYLVESRSCIVESNIPMKLRDLLKTMTETGDKLFQTVFLIWGLLVRIRRTQTSPRYDPTSGRLKRDLMIG